MKILILDDDETRHSRFARWFAGFDVTHTRTLDQFQKELEGNSPFTYVFLDHDLEGQPDATMIDQGYGKLPGTGVHAAKMVVALPPDKLPEHVVVHSWNPAGAETMVDGLRDNGIKTTRWEFDPRADLKLK